MSTLVDRRQAVRTGVRPSRSRRPLRSGGVVPCAGSAPTLDDAIVDLWERLLSGEQASCPVCRSPMEARYGAAGHLPVGGRCADCGASFA